MDWLSRRRCCSSHRNRPRRRQTRDLEHAFELAVSRYIGNLPFLWVAVGDLPGPDSDRGKIERNAIGLLSDISLLAPGR